MCSEYNVFGILAASFWRRAGVGALPAPAHCLPFSRDLLQVVEGGTGPMRLSWAQGVSRRRYLRGEDCQNSARLRGSPAAAVHMEAEGGGEGTEPREGVWLMSARRERLRGATSRRAARRVEAARAGSGADADENLPDKQKRLPATSSAWSQLCHRVLMGGVFNARVTLVFILKQHRELLRVFVLSQLLHLHRFLS